MKDLWQKEKLWIHSKKVFKLRDSRASASANPGSASVYDNVKVHDDGDDGDDDGDDDDDDDDGWREQELCSGAEAGGLWEREGPQGGTKVPVHPIYSHSLFLFSHISL